MTASDECLVIGLNEEPRAFARLFYFLLHEIQEVTRRKRDAVEDHILAGEPGCEPHGEPFFTALPVQCDGKCDEAYLIRPYASTRYVWIL
ncbi:hypothetical protein [Achromobacter sp. UBA2119]|uniref:hypothetical protein n=1 Tax=Achromobacter sp. UBA2119 TaxID=1945911 RepID=UPI00257CA12A|nr:hypothetical protein [Achromobacter sp. UBA2119]